MDKYQRPLSGYHIAMQISGILLCATFGSLAGGIWLDRYFGTAPCFILLLMLVGLAFAMYNVIRTIKPKQ